jgi:hypothetical protein
MANAILTPTAVTREALRVLHQKLRFIGSINRQYDDSFAKRGAKIGDSLKIRLPNQYIVRDGATLNTQDTTETSTTLQIATQKGVDLNFTSADLTLHLDDFSKRILDPAMAVLAAAMEADALNMRKDVYQQVNNIGVAATFAKVLQGRKKLIDSLVPEDSNLTALLNTQDNIDLVDALKGLFNSQAEIGKQYKSGVMGHTAGFDFMESTHLSTHARSTAVATGYLVNDTVASGDAVITVDTGTGAFVAGDVFTIAGVNSVHPETKVSTGLAQQFVVTAASAGGGVTLSISPAMISTGARQNISALPADDAAITVVGTVSTPYGQSLMYHRDAFTFATADLVLPDGVDFARREEFDGISLRIVRQYDINNDTFPVRLDVLYGYKTLRAQWATRLANN